MRTILEFIDRNKVINRLFPEQRIEKYHDDIIDNIHSDKHVYTEYQYMHESFPGLLEYIERVYKTLTIDNILQCMKDYWDIYAESYGKTQYTTILKDYDHLYNRAAEAVGHIAVVNQKDKQKDAIKYFCDNNMPETFIWFISKVSEIDKD